jgi:hypothetical protein
MSDDLPSDDHSPDDHSPPGGPARNGPELDELLSADIDGELDAAARDLGITMDEARARMRAHPDAAGRRRALVAARDELAQAPEIDELVAQRLRAKAIRAAETEHRDRADERRQRRRVLVGLSAAAAAIVAVAGIAVGLNAHHGSESASSKATGAPVIEAGPGSSTTAAPKRATAGVLALGSFADVHTLGEAAVVQAATAPLSAPAASNVPAAPGAASTAPPGVTGSGAVSGSTSPTVLQPAFAESQNAAESQVLDCASPPPGAVGDRLVLHATAILAGQPVIVLVFAGAAEHVVVIDRPNCALINLQQLR